MKIGNYLIAVAVVLLSLIAAVIVTAGPFAALVDITSLLIIILLTLPTSFAAYGWKGYWSSYGLAFLKEPASRADYGKAIAVIESSIRKIYLAAALGTVLGLVMMFVMITEDTGFSERNVNYAIALITVVYALIIHVGLIEPIRGYLRRQYAALEK